MQNEIIHQCEKVLVISDELNELSATGLNNKNPSEKLEIQCMIYGNIFIGVQKMLKNAQ